MQQTYLGAGVARCGASGSCFAPKFAVGSGHGSRLAVLIALVGGTVLAGVSAARRTSSAFPQFVSRYGFDAGLFSSTPSIPGSIAHMGDVRSMSTSTFYANGNVVVNGQFLPGNDLGVFEPSRASTGRDSQADRWTAAGRSVRGARGLLDAAAVRPPSRVSRHRAPLRAFPAPGRLRQQRNTDTARPPRQLSHRGLRDEHARLSLEQPQLLDFHEPSFRPHARAHRRHRFPRDGAPRPRRSRPSALHLRRQPHPSFRWQLRLPPERGRPDHRH